MNTIDLINKLAVDHNITTGRAEMIISILVERIVEKLKKEGALNITNFGSFSITKKENESSSYIKLNESVQRVNNYITFTPDRVFLENINSQ